jgi:hypothetical protein
VHIVGTLLYLSLKCTLKTTLKNAKVFFVSVGYNFFFTSNEILYSQLTPPFDPQGVTAFDKDLKLTANKIKKK